MPDTQRLPIAHLRVDGRDVRLKYADVVAVRRDGGDLDWELVAYGLDPDEQFAPGPYRIDADVLDGPTVSGDAILVRSINGSHVFRGAGELE
nr:MetaGeneMark_Unknown Function [uncultured bacterium]